MEPMENTTAMLELMDRGAFWVKDGIIAGANDAARKRMVPVGTAVSDILLTGQQEYAEFPGGSLFLTLELAGLPQDACVSKMNGFDLFLLDQDEATADLQALALAAQELRQPLSSILSITDRLFPISAAEAENKAQIARMNRSLHQLLRIVSNMSDAYRYSQEIRKGQQTRNICSLIEEYFSGAQPLAEQAGLCLRYTGPNESIYCLVDDEKLERSVYNILSNAMKFAPQGSVIDAKLTQKGRMLYLTVQDQGPGFPENIRGSSHTQFRREPGIEDSRFGIGLGMVLIRSAASAHGGTVLLDQGPDRGNRLTMTLSIRQSSDSTLRNGSILQADYAGERDHRLLELSDCLPAELYWE